MLSNSSKSPTKTSIIASLQYIIAAHDLKITCRIPDESQSCNNTVCITVSIFPVVSVECPYTFCGKLCLFICPCNYMVWLASNFFVNYSNANLELLCNQPKAAPRKWKESLIIPDIISLH